MPPSTEDPNSSARKRQRREGEPEGDVDVMRHSEFWLEDGNIVLRADDTVFRVYRGWLARQSEVFGSMLAMPQPSQSEMYEGYPLVHLPDSAEDLGYFIKALYDTSFFQPDSEYNFKVIAGILRLSTKYLVNHLRQRAEARLRLHYPSTLEEFDAIQETNEKFSRDGLLPHPIHVVQLATECCLPIIIPAALYMCIQRFDETLDGSLLEETSIRQYLSPPDLKACYNASRTLLSLWLMTWQTWNVTCSGKSCDIPRRNEFSSLAARLVNPDLAVDPLQGLCKPPTAEFCGRCRGSICRLYVGTRVAIWTMLPELFNVEPWETLRGETLSADSE